MVQKPKAPTGPLAAFHNCTIHEPKQTQPMRFLVSLLFSLFLLQGATAQVITRLSGGTSYFYYLPPLGTDDLAGVVSVAAFNDTIILPGGIITPYYGLSISKPLTFVGAGTFPSGTPVTGRTVIPSVNPGSFSIVGAGAGSSFHGISFEDNIAVGAAMTNISFTRCEFSSISLAPNPGTDPNGVQFKQCAFKFGLSLGESQNVSIDNCIISSGISMYSTASNISISQCILLFPNTNALVGGAPNSTWTNNIFVLENTSAVNFSTSGTVQSNLFALTGTPVLTNTGTALYTGNQVIPLGPLGASNPNFENISSVDAFNMNVDDYQLKPNGQANAMTGIGGYKVGIFSGASGNPWKPEAIPFNPHWTGLLPTGGTLGATNGGTINVTIQGAAQQN